MDKTTRYSKILLVSPSSKTGGKASFTKTLIDVYTQNNISFHHIDVTRASGKKIYVRILQHIQSFFFYKLTLIKKLTTNKYDVVQIHTSSYFDFYDLSFFVIISKLFRKRVILRNGGGRFPLFYKNSYWPTKIYIRWVLSLANRLIVLSKYWYEYYSSLGIKKESLFILPNFVNHLQFDPARKNYNSEKIEILFMPADSLSGKGFFDIKSSILKLAKNHKYLLFHIVGPDVSKHLNKPGIENIKTYKVIRGNQKTTLFDKCHIFLLPTHAEGFPNALIEAMAAGMSVIASDIPEIKCLVKNNYDCLLFEMGSEKDFEEQFIKLLIERKKIEEIGYNARKSVEKNYAQNLMPRYLRKLYSE